MKSHPVRPNIKKRLKLKEKLNQTSFTKVTEVEPNCEIDRGREVIKLRYV